MFVYLITLTDYRDNAKIESSYTTISSFSSTNYECVGNETSIHDCPNNDKNCTFFRMFFPTTELRCKRKTYLFDNDIFTVRFLILFNKVSDTDEN